MAKDRVQELVDRLESNRKAGRATVAKTDFKGYSQKEVDEAIKRQGEIISGKTKTGFDEAIEMQSKMRKKFMNQKGY